MRTESSRFDNVLEHPDYASAPAEPVLPADAGMGIAVMAGPLLMSLFGGLFLLVALSLIVTVGMPWPLALVFIAGGLAFVYGGIAKVRGEIGLRQAPIQRTIAVIVKERTEISGGDERSSASTSYYTTLQTRDGTRTEVRVSGALVGRLVVDDIGVAYVKESTLDLGLTTIQSRTLVEFIRFDVD